MFYSAVRASLRYKSGSKHVPPVEEVLAAALILHGLAVEHDGRVPEPLEHGEDEAGHLWGDEASPPAGRIPKV